MSVDLHGSPTENHVADGAGALARRTAILRRNLAASRALRARRPDRRFRLVPYDGFQIANGAAMTLTAFALLVVLLDPYLTVWQAALPPVLVEAFKVLTELGQSDWILIGTGLFLILALLTDAASLRPRQRAQRAVRAFAAGYVFTAVALSGVIAQLLKRLLGRARPKFFEDSGSFAFNFWSGDSGWASFPSGHATTAMALGVSLALLFPRLRWTFLCAGLWIAVSRLFTRAHYPSDVLAGCLLGGLTAWLLARLLARTRLVFGFGHDGRLVRRRGASGRLA